MSRGRTAVIVGGRIERERLPGDRAVHARPCGPPTCRPAIPSSACSATVRANRASHAAGIGSSLVDRPHRDPVGDRRAPGIRQHELERLRLLVVVVVVDDDPDTTVRSRPRGSSPSVRRSASSPSALVAETGVESRVATFTETPPAEGADRRTVNSIHAPSRRSSRRPPRATGAPPRRCRRPPPRPHCPAATGTV